MKNISYIYAQDETISDLVELTQLGWWGCYWKGW